jgi:putative MATE family efflux protein
VTLNCIIGIAFMVFCLIFLKPILFFFGASDNTITYACQYMRIILLGNVITHLYFGLNSMLRSSGHPRTAMRLTLFTVISNTILDPVFIFVFGLGIKGAAIATVLCQAMALAWTLRFYTRKDNLLHLPKGFFGLDWRIAKDSLAIGMGPFLMNAASCIVAMFINQQLLKYGGDLAIGAYGIANRITFVFVMIVMGICQGMQPIAGYNYGAEKFDRLMRVLTLAIIAATVVMVIGWALAMLFPYYMARIFTTDQELIAKSITGIRLNMLLFPIIGFQAVVTNFFQCIGKVRIAIFLSLSRQLLFLLPLIWILPMLWGLDGVWAALPTSDLIAAVVAAASMAYFMPKLKQQAHG